MSVYPKKVGEWELFYPKKTASTAFSQNSIVDWPASATGYVVAATSSTTKFAGLCQRAVTSGDSDYASNTAIPVLRPLVATAEVVATVASGVATDVGLRCDLTDAVTVNRGASSVGRFLVTGYISTTQYTGYFLNVAQTGAA